MSISHRKDVFPTPLRRLRFQLRRGLPAIWLVTALLPLVCDGVAAGETAGEAAESQQPNVLFLLADDQRPDTIHALGNDIIRTPHLDQLVREGTAFTRAVTAIPICVASRAEILTGRDGLQNGKADFGFSPAKQVTCWAEAMSAAGYDTGYVGKWHTTGRPSARGYARSIGLYSGGGGRFPLTVPVDWKGKPVTGYSGWVFQTDDRQLFPERGVGLTPDISEQFATAAIEFIATPRDRPFFLHVNFTAPHDPLMLPSRYRDAYDPDEMPLPANFAPQHPFDHGNFAGRDEVLFHWPRMPDETRRALAVYYSVIEHLDEQIGHILHALERAGQRENTIVIYSSDHGLAIGSHGLRGKQNMYDHSIGVPLIFRGPGITANRKTPAQCYLRDLYPTVCDLCRVPVPKTVQGTSLRPVLQGEREQLYDAVFCHYRDSQQMIRTDEWKYIVYPLVGVKQLFHLSEDPAEQRNIVNEPEYQTVANDLRLRLQRMSPSR
ncbi:MAG: sulfatase-like hydrolase/transferase [Planctomycetaceae bacterium]